MRRDQLSPDAGRTTDIEGGYSLDPDVELSDSGVLAGSYGAAGSVPAFTVDSKGRISAAANVAIAITQSQVANLTVDLAAKAPLASPALTGTPTAPTAAPGTNTAQVSTTAFVAAAIAALVASSPAALDTLNELATALGNDPNFATTMIAALAGKLGATAQAADSAKLGTQLPAYYQAAATAITTSNIAAQAVASAGSLTGATQTAAVTWSNTQTFTGGFFVGLSTGTNNPVASIRAGDSGAGTATLKMGSTNREWTLVVGANPYTLSLNYVGTDAPLASIITVTTAGALIHLKPVGFNGATPIAKPTVTGSRGSNAALASLLTALANIGLLTDSST